MIFLRTLKWRLELYHGPQRLLRSIPYEFLLVLQKQLILMFLHLLLVFEYVQMVSHPMLTVIGQSALDLRSLRSFEASAGIVVVRILFQVNLDFLLFGAERILFSERAQNAFLNLLTMPQLRKELDPLFTYLVKVIFLVGGTLLIHI